MPKTPSVKNNSSSQKPNVVYRTIPNIWGVITAVACFLFILYLVYYVSLGVYTKVIIGVAVVIVAGELLARLKNSARLTYGTYMFRTELGLRLMDRLSKIGVWFWNGFSDWGLVIGFGLLAYFMFKKQISKKMLALGVFSTIMITIFLIPYLGVALKFIEIPQIDALTLGYSPSVGNVNYTLLAVDALGGFVLYLIYGLGLTTFITLQRIAITLPTLFTGTPNYAPVNGIIPGIVPILPGITIPFFAGILAFVVVLIVHEFSHGILARIAKIKVISSGLLMFGIVPIGAFVEPDEKGIKKLNAVQQNRISVAGVSANILLSVILLLPMLLFVYYIVPQYQHSYVYIAGVAANAPANGIIAYNSILLKWNSYNVTTLAAFEQVATHVPNTNISIVTNNGSYVIKTNSSGYIGVTLGEVDYDTGGVVGQIALFLYSFVALAFLLNFFVAVVNFIPIPGLDGWRIFATSIKRRKITFAISAYLLIALLISVLPYSWEVPLIGVPVVLIAVFVVVMLLRAEWRWVKGKDLA